MMQKMVNEMRQRIRADISYYMDDENKLENSPYLDDIQKCQAMIEGYKKIDKKLEDSWEDDWKADYDLDELE